MSEPEIPVDSAARAGSRECQRLATAGFVVTWLGATLALVALVGGGASNGANIGFGLAIVATGLGRVATAVSHRAVAVGSQAGDRLPFSIVAILFLLLAVVLLLLVGLGILEEIR